MTNQSFISSDGGNTLTKEDYVRPLLPFWIRLFVVGSIISLLWLSGIASEKIVVATHVSLSETWIIENYDVFGMIETSRTVIHNGSLPTPLRYKVSAFDENRLTDLTFNFTGGGNCVQEADNDIFCTGTLDHVTISFRYAHFPTVSGDKVIIQRSLRYPFEQDVSFDLFYPNYLNYSNSTLSPVVNTTGHLQWTQAHTARFDLEATLQDSRIKLIFLPLLMK